MVGFDPVLGAASSDVHSARRRRLRPAPAPGARRRPRGEPGLAADSGARRGELVALRHSGLDGRVLSIERGLSRGVLGSTKTGRNRRLTPGATTTALIEDHFCAWGQRVELEGDWLLAPTPARPRRGQHPPPEGLRCRPVAIRRHRCQPRLARRRVLRRRTRAVVPPAVPTGPVAAAEPKALRWQLWHSPARLVRHARQHLVRILDGWPTTRSSTPPSASAFSPDSPRAPTELAPGSPVTPRHRSRGTKRALSGLGVGRPDAGMALHPTGTSKQEPSAAAVGTHLVNDRSQRTDRAAPRRPVCRTHKQKLISYNQALTVLWRPHQLRLRSESSRQASDPVVGVRDRAPIGLQPRRTAWHRVTAVAATRPG